jgi:hypothetical protein
MVAAHRSATTAGDHRIGRLVWMEAPIHVRDKALDGERVTIRDCRVVATRRDELQPLRDVRRIDVKLVIRVAERRKGNRVQRLGDGLVAARIRARYVDLTNGDIATRPDDDHPLADLGHAKICEVDDRD